MRSLGHRHVLASLLALAMLLGTSLTPAHAKKAKVSAATKCTAAKLKAAGTAAKNTLLCHAKAAKDGTGADASCLEKAEKKLSASFAKAEAKAVQKGASCPRVGDLASLTESLQGGIAEAVALLRPASTASKCTSLKLKSTGKLTFSALKAFARHESNADPEKLAANLSKARSKLSKGFATAEDKDNGACLGQEKTDEVIALVNVAVAQIVATLIGGCRALSLDLLVVASQNDAVLTDHLAFASATGLQGPLGVQRCANEPGGRAFYAVMFANPATEGPVILVHAVDGEGILADSAFVEVESNAVTYFREGGGLRFAIEAGSGITRVDVVGPDGQPLHQAGPVKRGVTSKSLLDPACVEAYGIYLICEAAEVVKAILAGPNELLACKGCADAIVMASTVGAALAAGDLVSPVGDLIGAGMVVGAALGTDCVDCFDGKDRVEIGQCRDDYLKVPCQDGVACTIKDGCHGGACRSVPPFISEDLCLSASQCRRCNPNAPAGSDGCSNLAPVGSECSDFEPASICRERNQCDANGVCQNGLPLTCKSCTIGSIVSKCDSDGVCQPCVDQGASSCAECFGLSPCDPVNGDLDCSALNGECQIGSCDLLVDGCVAGPRAPGTPCDQADLCTVGICDGAGSCTSTPVDCSGIAGSCEVGLCDRETGQCFTEPLPDGTACDLDGASCTTDTCQGGTCIAGAAQQLSCNSGPRENDPDADCLWNLCDPGHENADARGCVVDASVEFNGSPCDDGAACSSSEGHCFNAAGGIVECIANTVDHSACNGGPQNNDGDADCIWNLCEPFRGGADEKGCRPVSYEETGSPCEDGWSCTTGDVCVRQSNGVAVCAITREHLLCNDAPQDNDPDADCSWNLCEPGSPLADVNGCVIPGTTEAVGSPCDDGFACTVGDACQSDGRCRGASDSTLCNDAPRDNDPDDDCAWNVCSPVFQTAGPDGCRTDGGTNELVGSPCDDHNPCTVDDLCRQGDFGVGCLGGSVVPNCP